MKITTWNVNGIRSAIGKGLFDWVQAQQPDVLCLQEIKARPEQLAEEARSPASYEAIWNPAMRPGYSGVATFTRQPPHAYDLGMGAPAFDDEGRLIRTRHQDFWLYNVYFPNGQRDLGRLDYKLAFYERLLEEIDQIHEAGGQVIVTGDFNTAHREIDLANPKQNSTTSGFLPQERRWIDQYLEHGLVDAYRQLYPERQQYTWWTYRFNARKRNIGWRLDYFLVSEGLMERVQEVIVHEDAEGSDHCPVTLLME